MGTCAFCLFCATVLKKQAPLEPKAGICCSPAAGSFLAQKNNGSLFARESEGLPERTITGKGVYFAQTEHEPPPEQYAQYLQFVQALHLPWLSGLQRAGSANFGAQQPDSAGAGTPTLESEANERARRTNAFIALSPYHERPRNFPQK